MRKLRIASMVLFIVSLILFGGYIFKEEIGKDKTGPVITLDSDNIEVSIHNDREALLKGVTATDKRDGDVTDTLQVESVGPFHEDGKRTVTYVAFDTDGHVSHASRTMSYTDYTDPVFEISESLVYPVLQSRDTVSIVLNGVTVTDCLDGDLTDTIELLFDEGASEFKPGVYGARLSVINSAGGCAEIPVSVEFCDPVEYRRLPLIKLTECLIYLDKGEAFNAADYLESATIAGSEYTFVKENGTYGSKNADPQESGQNATEYSIDKSLAAISGSVDTNTPGCYELTYTLEDTVFGTGTGTARLYVVVREGGRQ